MTKTRWSILAGGVLLLAAIQALGLDRMEEKLREDSFNKVPDVPGVELLQTTIAVRFFGATRAIMIDYLWIKLKQLEKEKRWYQRRNVLRYISYYQPRNPGVWVHLGWHSAYNVANGFTDPDRGWEWVKFGLEWLHRGVSNLPDHPEIKYEIGLTLSHKPSWKGEGWQDDDLLRRIEADDELQAILQGRETIERRMSAFELSIIWFDKAREDLARMNKSYMYTQMGLYLGQDSMDGFALNAMHHEAMRHWRAGRWDEAKDWFRRATERAALIQERYDAVSPVFADREDFYRKLPEIVELDRRAAGGGKEEELALLQKLQNLMTRDSDMVLGPLDEGYLWSAGNPESRLNALKLKYVDDEDIHECNDALGIFSTPIRPKALYQANLEPPGLDRDFYAMELPEAEGVPLPLPMRLQFDRPDSAGMDLKVTVLGEDKVPLATGEVRGRGDIAFEIPAFGKYYVRVEPLDPGGPRPEDTRYTLRWLPVR